MLSLRRPLGSPEDADPQMDGPNAPSLTALTTAQHSLSLTSTIRYTVKGNITYTLYRRDVKEQQEQPAMSYPEHPH